MKKSLLKMLLTGALVITGYRGFSQEYLTEMYNYIKVSNVFYDSTRSVNILYGQVQGQPPIISCRLQCDIYRPVNSNTQRPLVIVAHTGSFLPPLINQQATGSKDDSAIVELCTRLARRGFVAVAMNYRLGWNAATRVSSEGTEQLLQATYRGIQDVRNCIRYMRTNASVYGIDTSKIIVGGQGTGGYIALALGTIDKKSEIEDVAKFQRGDFTPMVNTDTLGDWMGLGGLPEFVVSGESHISADAHMVFNYGGAMGHIDWLEANSLPIVSMQVTSDPFAPYNTGNVIVPTTGTTVITSASGTGQVIPKANSLGINDKFNKYLLDVYSINGYLKAGQGNMYPFTPTPNPFEGAPWEWWDRPLIQSKTSTLFYNTPVPANGYTADTIAIKVTHNMSAQKGRAYIDTVVNFIAPRIALQFGLVNSGNDALRTSFNLLMGASRAEIKGDSSQKVNFAWVPANTTGFGNMTYTWKLSKADQVDFANPVGSVTITNGAPMTSIDYTTLSSYMSAAGVAIGDSADFKWAVEADLNGSKMWSLDSGTIRLVRGQVSSVKEIVNVSRYLSVYPNPASDVLNIDVDAKAGSAAAYRVMDVTGRELAAGTAGSNSFSIDVNALNAGLYFVHVSMHDGSIATKRVLIR